VWRTFLNALRSLIEYYGVPSCDVSAPQKGVSILELNTERLRSSLGELFVEDFV
jgi:hypothetical protein